MPNLNLRNVSNKTYKKIKKLAKRNKRSINSEVNNLLSNVVENEEDISKRKYSFYEQILKIRIKPRKKIDSTELIRQMRNEE